MIVSANNFLNKYYQNLVGKVKFAVGDAAKLPFPDNSFDFVISGGSTAFFANIPEAVKEYSRVVRPWGFIGDINFYFHKNPPDSLIKKLNKLMGINIQKWDANYWVNNYKKTGLEIYYHFENKMSSVSDKKIVEYSTYIVENKKWPKEIKKFAKDRLINIYRLFNEEHKYLVYGVFVLRKRTYKEIVLF